MQLTVLVCKTFDIYRYLRQTSFYVAHEKSVVSRQKNFRGPATPCPNLEPTAKIISLLQKQQNC